MQLNNIQEYTKRVGGAKVSVKCGWRVSDSGQAEFFLTNYDCGEKLLKSYGTGCKPTSDNINDKVTHADLRDIKKSLKKTVEIRKAARKCSDQEIRELTKTFVDYIQRFEQTAALAALKAAKSGVAV